MISKRRPTAGLAAVLVGASLMGAAVPTTAARGGHPPAFERPAQEQGDVIIPGGRRFVAAAAGMRRVDGNDERFLSDLAAYLSVPMVLDYSQRVIEMVDELRRLQQFLAESESQRPGVVPSLAQRGTPEYRKAVELLDFLGFRVGDETERIQLQRRVGDREARQRRMLDYLGFSVPLQSRLWAAGEPIVINIEDDRAPLLFGRAAWAEQVFEETLDGDGAFDALLGDPAALNVLAGYAALDRATRERLFPDVGLRQLHDSEAIAAGFLKIAPYLRADETGILFAGGDRDAWQSILGQWNGTGELIERLVTKDNARPAHLWRALSLIPERRANYLLTLGHSNPALKNAWATELYDAIRLPDFAPQPMRWPEDIAELFVSLQLRADGQGIDWPGGAAVWLAAVEDDNPLAGDAELDALLGRYASVEDWGPVVDQRLIGEIIRESDPERDGPTAIRKYKAIKSALRYQPISATRRAIPLLYRDYRRFGRAYGFFVMPTPLPAGTAEALVRHLRQVDAIELDEARIDAIRQLQASMMLLREVLLNDLLLDEDRERILTTFLELPVTGAASDAALGGVSDSHGYGPAVTEWWREDLVPAMARGLQANGWPGDPEDLGAVVVTSLVGRIGVNELEVDGIDYNFTPAAMQGRRVYTHLLLQQQPSFENLFRLDEIAVAVGNDGSAPGLANEVESIVGELESRMPPNIGDEEVTEALPVTVSRDQLFAAAAALSSELREATPQPATVRAFRESVTAYLGDALVGLMYALHMGDPSSFTYQQGHIAWLHRLIIAELEGGGPEDLFSPWAPTAESWILDEGSRMHNSLYGAPDILSRWNIEDLIPSGGPRDPAAGESWAPTLAYIHLPSLTPAAQTVIARRHRLATSWIREAVAARDAYGTPSFWASADPTAPAPRLAEALRILMEPVAWQRFVDAVEAGREPQAMDLVSDGNRYLLALGLEGYDAEAPASARWLIDQMVGMPLHRRGDYLGLETPPPIRYGEGGDQISDAPNYTRIFDLRVRLAVLMEERGYPAALHARLLLSAMADVLANMIPDNWQPWHNMLDAVDDRVTEGVLGQWVLDLAFGDELSPSDPSLALEELAETGDLAGAPAGRTGALGVPVDEDQYQATFGAQVNLVTVDIAAWDEDRKFVADLTLDDIVLTRDGEPVRPAFLRLEGSPESSVFLDDLPPGVPEKVTATPRNFVLVADMLTTSPQDWERILLDVTEFVRAGINADDQLALVTIDERGVPRVTRDFTIDHEYVAEVLEAQVGNSFATSDREQSFIDLSVILCDNGLCSQRGEGADGEACRPLQIARFYGCVTSAANWEDVKFRMAEAQLGRWSIEANLKAQQVMSALTQVASMLDLGDPFDRQKYVVLLSSGFERQPGSIHHQTLVEYATYSEAIDPMSVRTLRDDLSPQLADLTRIMQRCRCTVYSLATLGQAAFSETSAQLPNSLPVVSRFAARTTLQGPLNAIARDSGGDAFFGSDMSVGFRDVLEETRLRYVVGFVMEDSPAGTEPSWHEIEVQIDRPDVESVKAREGFLWPRR